MPTLPHDAWRTHPAALSDISPDGRLLALLYARTDTLDMVARERVYVHEVATGAVVSELDGPDIARALVWATAATLLVARDGARGCSVLTLHELPDGGVVGRCEVPLLGGHAPQFQFTRDRTRLMVTAPSLHLRGEQYDVAWLFALPSLANVGTVDCAAVRRVLGIGFKARDTLVLHPDGHLVAAMARNTEGGDRTLVVIPVEGPDEAWRIGGFEHGPFDACWAGPHTLVARDWRELVTVGCGPPGELRTVDLGDNRVILPAAIHPDGERVLLMMLRGKAYTSDDADDRSEYLAVLHLASGTLQEIAPARWSPVAHRPRWTMDGRAVLYGTPREGESSAFEITDVDGHRGTRRVATFDGEDSWVDSVCGERVFMLTVQHGDGRVERMFVDPDAVLDALDGELV